VTFWKLESINGTDLTHSRELRSKLALGNGGTQSELSAETSEDGLQSMKIQGHSNASSRVTRSIPLMNRGDICFDVFIADNPTQIFFEFKDSFSSKHYVANRFQFWLSNGFLYTKTFDDTIVRLGTLSSNLWHNVRISFDLEKLDAHLYVDNCYISNLPVHSDGGGICYFNISEGSSNTSGMTLYIDNFIARPNDVLILYSSATTE